MPASKLEPSKNGDAARNNIIILESRELVAPVELSARTLEEMDRAVENLRAGDVSEPIDFSLTL